MTTKSASELYLRLTIAGLAAGLLSLLVAVLASWAQAFGHARLALGLGVLSLVCLVFCVTAVNARRLARWLRLAARRWP